MGERGEITFSVPVFKITCSVVSFLGSVSTKQNISPLRKNKLMKCFTLTSPNCTTKVSRKIISEKSICCDSPPKIPVHTFDSFEIGCKVAYSYRLFTKVTTANLFAIPQYTGDYGVAMITALQSFCASSNVNFRKSAVSTFHHYLNMYNTYRMKTIFIKLLISCQYVLRLSNLADSCTGWGGESWTKMVFFTL
jgi:hypothetical protein